MKKRTQKFLVVLMVFLCFLRGEVAFSETRGDFPQLEITIPLNVYKGVEIPEDHKPQSIRWLVDWLEEKDHTGQKRLLTVGKYIKAVTLCLVYDGEDEWLFQDSTSLERHHYLTPILRDLERLKEWIPIKRSFGYTAVDNFAPSCMLRAWKRLDNDLNSAGYSSRVEAWKEAVEKRMTLEGLLSKHYFYLSGADILLPQVGLVGGGLSGVRERELTLENAWDLLVEPGRVRESESAFYASLAISFQQGLAEKRAKDALLLWPDSSGESLMFDVTDLDAFLDDVERELGKGKRDETQISILHHLEYAKAHSSFTYCWENWNDWDPQWAGFPEELIHFMALMSYPVENINFVLPSSAISENCYAYFSRFELCVQSMKKIWQAFSLPKDKDHVSSSEKWCPAVKGSPYSWAISLLCPAKQGLAWGVKPSFDIPLLGNDPTYRPKLRPLSRRIVEIAIRFAKKEKCDLGLIFPTTALAEHYSGLDFEANLIKWVIGEFSSQEFPEEKREKAVWDHEGSNCFNIPGLREKQVKVFTR